MCPHLRPGPVSLCTELLCEGQVPGSPAEDPGSELHAHPHAFSAHAATEKSTDAQSVLAQPLLSSMESPKDK